MEKILKKIISFENKKIDGSIINDSQIEKLVENLIKVFKNKIDGDVVELGCYVGESSKYLAKTLIELKSKKRLYVFDSFEGLPDLSKWEEGTGWRPRTLKTTEEVLISNFTENNLPIPIIHKDWFKDIPNYKIPQKICFAFLDGDFYESIYDSLNKVYDKVSDGGVILFHDYKRPDLPGVEGAIKDFCKEKGIEDTTIEITGQLGLMVKNSKVSNLEKIQDIKPNSKTENKKLSTTLVTGLWDIKRDELSEGWARSFESHYLKKFEELLKLEINLIIFGDDELEKFVFSRRSQENTQFIKRKLNWFKENEFYEKIQKIRTNPDWYNQVGWLSESTQAKLELYNPLVMSKMFLLHDAKILDKFDSEFMYWIDAGITNTVHVGYFTHDDVIGKLESKIKKFMFICFPYETTTEIHGFKFPEINNYAGKHVKKVARAGFFGGKKESIGELNSIYYSLLSGTLSDGFMGTEESIFTIMTYKYPNLIEHFEIDGNGLINKFFEDCKNEKLISIKESNVISDNSLDTDKTALYVITFNSPNQLRTLVKSMQEYDNNFLNKPKKYILNNSTDRTTDEDYKKIADEHSFEIIWPEKNLGITGGRQFIAEHFETTGLDYYFFFEDDMFFYNGAETTCKNGFNRKIDNLYNKVLDISKKEDFGFLKMNFTEFYGDNSTQWSWYNVPQVFRESHWPEKPSLPVQGLDPEAPRTNFKNIKSYKGVPYAIGEIYLCNWPVLFSKTGNYKCYLETKYASPFEQTIMSHNFQETIKGNLKPGILLMTPTEHDRFEHYDASLRKEC
jgi:O-methyltransferase